MQTKIFTVTATRTKHSHPEVSTLLGCYTVFWDGLSVPPWGSSKSISQHCLKSWGSEVLNYMLVKACSFSSWSCYSILWYWKHVARQNEINSSICVTVLNQIIVIAEWQVFRLINVWLLFYGSIWFSWQIWNCFIYRRKLSSWYNNRKLFALPNSFNQNHMDTWISVFSPYFYWINLIFKN